MEIQPQWSTYDLEHIASHMTQEGTQQANLYGIADIADRLIVDLCGSDETGTFIHNHIPVAVFGVHRATRSEASVRGTEHDKLFLVITTGATENYREFSRVAKEWLSKRDIPIQCTIPKVSKQTLRMITKWGFRVVRTTVQSHVMEYRGDPSE